MNIAAIHQLFIESKGICTDTRNLKQDQIFFALKGDNFNGNKYAKEALNNGAKIAIIDEEEFHLESKTILVEDVLTCLQELAKYHRIELKTPIIGITGSNGKTTTKELLLAVLKTQYKVYATFGNLNNHIGVPLSLLSITKDHQLAIIEMGANHQKEIESYCKWVLPNYGLITNIGKAHLEGFGGIEGIIKGKTELYKAIESNQGHIFYNADSKILKEHSTKVLNKKSYAQKESSDYPFKVKATKTFIEVAFGNENISSHLIGSYNGTNIGAAIAVGRYFDIKPSNIKKALEAYIPENNRSQIIEQNNNHIILDAYNANPTSMEAALQSFHQIDVLNKVVYLGDMFEVGATTKAEHLAVVHLLKNLNLKEAVLVGKHFIEHKCPEFTFFETTDQAKAFFKQQNYQNYHVLIKGSRGMKMERIVDEKQIVDHMI